MSIITKVDLYGWLFLEKVKKGLVQDFQASQATHGNDDIMTKNLWSQVTKFTLFAVNGLCAQPYFTNFDENSA